MQNESCNILSANCVKCHIRAEIEINHVPVCQTWTRNVLYSSIITNRSNKQHGTDARTRSERIANTFISTYISSTFERKTTGFTGIATFYGGIVNTHKLYRR
ncbi:hypothetical protein O3G_MSEX003014 [Manduca sexta]|uniref:Uncharacterized protein n=1 Tax=Manduca sexta TaxID=7130 RepID=A0A921YQX6_MANSE|nr:hypothetical protein O3G_MSEX003014 [Manduca sexta]